MMFLNLPPVPPENSEPKPNKTEPLPTLWNVPNPLWELIAKVMNAYDPRARTGRSRSDERLAFDGVMCRLRTG